MKGSRILPTLTKLGVTTVDENGVHQYNESEYLVLVNGRDVGGSFYPNNPGCTDLFFTFSPEGSEYGWPANEDIPLTVFKLTKMNVGE